MTLAGAKYHLERIALKLLWQTPVFHGIYRINKPSAILMYHGVDAHSSTQFNLRHCSKSDFHAQLSYLMRHYSVVPLKSLFQENQEAGSKPKIAITMDDGFENWYTQAFEVIQELKCPVTMFISRPATKDHLWLDVLDIYIALCSDPITIKGHSFKKTAPYHYLETSSGENLKLWLEKEGDLTNYHLVKAAFEKIAPHSYREADPAYWRLLTDEQIKEIAQCPYIEIGGHGQSHIPFTNLSTAELRKELVESKKELESLCNTTVESIAYPIGKYNSTIVDLIESVGYSYQLAVDYVEPTDRHDFRILPRVGIYSDYAKEGQMKRFVQQVNQAQW